MLIAKERKLVDEVSKIFQIYEYSNALVKELLLFLKD